MRLFYYPGLSRKAPPGYILTVWRSAQVVKGEDCKSFMQRFESALRLQFYSPKALKLIAIRV